MFDIRYILIIILLGIIVYLVYNLYSYQSSKVDKLKENINEKIDMEFEDVNDRLDEIEQLIEKRLNSSNKKMEDLYSLQNKMNEVYKMNSQSIINQINQYDEGIEDAGEQRDQIFNSVENSSVGKGVHENKNNNCFIKISQLKNGGKENFYMSPDNNKENGSVKSSNSEHDSNKNESESKTSISNSKISESSESSESAKSAKSSKLSISSINNIKNKYKNDTKLNKESDNSIVLEINDNFIKTPFNMESSPKVNNAYKSINEFSNLIKNNSVSKFNSDEMNKSSKKSNDSDMNEFLNNDNNSSNTKSNNNDEESSESNTTSNFDINKSDSNSCEEILMNNDPPLLHPDIINRMNFTNKSRRTNKIIDITT
jgi:hypothetical protein